MDKKEFEWTQREFAKRLGLKKYKKYPAGPLRTLLRGRANRRATFRT